MKQKISKIISLLLCAVMLLGIMPITSFATEETPHAHSWSSEWRNNDAYHWHNCTAEGCDVTDNSQKDGYGEHVYDNEEDLVCNTCDYTKPVNCTVSFRTYGGSSVATQTILAGGKVTKPADPTRVVDGRTDTFLGWYTDLTFSTLFDFENTKIYSNTALCAKWSANYVRFDTYGGSGTYTEQIIPAGGKVTKPADPTKEGATFLGWYINYTDEKPFDFENDTINVNTNLRAAWSHNTVTFYRVDSTIDPQSVPFGGKVTKPADPIKEGYTFKGWSDHTAFYDEFNFDTPIYSETDLYAYFTPITYKVSYFTFGGSSVNTEDVSFGKKATKPADPTRGSDTFLGWCTDRDCTIPFDFENTIINEDIRLYAKWSSNTVTFRAYNGTSNTTQTVPAGGKVTKPADPTKEGVTFLGWYKDYKAAPFDFENETINSNTDLRAAWSYNTVTFRYSSIEPQKVAFGEKMVKPADPIRDGFVFRGWSDNGGAFSEFNFDTPIYTDTHIYAWFDAVKPKLQGTVSIVGEPKIGETVSVDTSGITSTDPGELTYQWYYMDGYYTYNIENSNSTSITLTKGATHRLYVSVTAENYSGNLTSEPKDIKRGDCATAPVAATVTNTENTVTVTNITAGQEYVIAKHTSAPSAGWKNAADFDGVFADLDTNTTYYVLTRVAQTNQFLASEAVATSVTLPNHSWSSDWKADDTYHWHKCTALNCNVTVNSEKDGYGKHTGGTATCKDKAVCTICSTPYGEKNPSNHVGGTELINAKAADHKTQTKGYTGDTKCLGCNEILSTGTDIAPTAHDFAPADCTTPKTCKIEGCGHTEGAALGHTAGEWEVKTAAKIGVKGEEVKKCTVCDVELDSREIPAIEKPTEPTTKPTEPTEKPTDPIANFLLGDVNGDGKIKANDARTALRAAAKLEELDETAQKAADIDGNGKVTAAEARKILRFAAKLDKELK